MEGFCILRAGKLVIGSAISCCANRRQQTKCERCIRFPRYLFGIGRILAVNRNGIVTIRDDIWSGGAVHQGELHAASIPLHSDCPLFLWIWIGQDPRPDADLRQMGKNLVSDGHFCDMFSNFQT